MSDLISRKAVLALAKDIYVPTKDGTIYRHRCIDPGDIAELPSAYPESEEPPLGESPDYIPLSFHQLAEMIGEPVYIKDRGCKGHWEIITAVRKNLDGEDYAIRGNDRWQRIGNCIYRTKEGAYEDAG